jgi:hypothetical protein
MITAARHTIGVEVAPGSVQFIGNFAHADLHNIMAMGNGAILGGNDGETGASGLRRGQVTVAVTGPTGEPSVPPVETVVTQIYHVPAAR